MYNPVENPRRTRAELPLPGVEECFEYMSGVREAVLERLATLDLMTEDPLLDHGFVFRMVVQHEYQHNETILQTLQLKTGEPYHPGESVPHPVPPEDHPFGDGTMIRFPGGAVAIGTDDRSASYDNERPRHSVELAPFLIDAIPVTEVAYANFIAEGGYETRKLWSDEGWAWRSESGVRHVGPGDRHQANLPVGRGAADTGLRQRRCSYLRPGVGRDLRKEPIADRMLRDDRRRVGVDVY